MNNDTFKAPLVEVVYPLGCTVYERCMEHLECRLQPLPPGRFANSKARAPRLDASAACVQNIVAQGRDKCIRSQSQQ